jgi:Chaperone of endosialidase
MSVPYTFATATTSIPLSQLDSNFATAITLGNTAVQLGNTITTINNTTLVNTTISSGNATFTKITVPLHDAGSGNALTLQSNSATALYIDTSQKVGIGTTSPTWVLDVSSAQANMRLTSTTGTNNTLYRATNTGGTFYSGLENSTGSSFGAAYSGVMWHTGAYPLVFGTNNTECMRIDSSGNLLVGTTTNYATARLAVASRITLIGPTTGQGGDIFSYDSAGTQLGFLTLGSTDGPASNLDIALVLANSANRRIYVQNRSAGVYLADGGTSWTSNSDERLKTDLVPITDAANKVKTLRAVTGRFKTDEVGKSRSFLIAQDVQKVLPEAVDASDPDKLGVQYTDVIPLLVAALQEAVAKIDALETEVTALKAKVGA